uniref:Smoothelin n=1 Tax=Phallusia mammillata TaxID=59560 RepID=A0A6F9DTA0_9ASCI|nr:smoothelin [Phallusia mammillata]
MTLKMHTTNQEKVTDLQRKLSASNDSKERAFIRSQIWHLRDENDSGLRRSRRYKARSVPTNSSIPEQSIEQSVKTGRPPSISAQDFDNMLCYCGCENPNVHQFLTASGTTPAKDQKTNNEQQPFVMEKLCQYTDASVPLGKCNEKIGYDVITGAPGLEDKTEDSAFHSPIKSNCQKPNSTYPKEGILLLESGEKCQADESKKNWNQINGGETFSDQVPPPSPHETPTGGKGGSKSSSFPFFRGIRPSSSSSKEPNPPTSSVKEEPLGKRRFSKRFRRRSTKQIASSENTETVENSQEEPSSSTKPSSLTASPGSEDSPNETFSPRSTSSGESHSNKKSAKVILRAIGKRFLASKSKSPNEKSKTFEATHTTTEATTVNANNSNNVSVCTPERNKPVTNVPTSTPVKSATEIMAEVVARSRETARATSSATVFLRHKEPSVEVERANYEGKSLEELQELLDACNDYEGRAKIRKAIRIAKKSNEEKVAASPKSHLGNGSPVVSRSKVLLSTRKQETSSSKPWEAETPKGGLRTVSSVKFTPTAKPREFEPKSAPSRITRDRESNSNTPISRFTRGELSSSLRTHRPTFKAPEKGFDRSGSLKLSRPKDFIRSQQAPGEVHSIHHAQKITPERVVLESVTSADNVQVDSASSNEEDLPAQASAASPVLKRSESCKENHVSSSPPEVPAIPVVQGNKRRSLGILGRVLSVKIDSQSAPRRVKPPQEENTSPKQQAQSPQKDLSIVPEETQTEKLVTQTTTKTIVLGGKSPVKPFNVVPVDISNTSKTSVEVTCTFVTPEPADLSITEVDAVQEEPKPSVDLHSEVKDILGEILEQIGEDCEVKKETEPSIEVEIEQVPVKEPIVEVSVEPEPTKVQITNKETVLNDLEPQTAESVQSVEEKHPNENGKESVEIIKDQENVTVQKQEVIVKKSLLVTEDKPLEKEKLSLPLEKPLSPKQSSESEDSSSCLTSSSDQESDSEEEMESRFSSRRYGGTGGSVKSRILATEDKNRTALSPDVSKIRKARQNADARALRGSEGVRSRLNKFSSDSSKNENLTSNVSIRNRSTQNGSVGKSRPLAQVNGSIKRSEVNNNDVTKSPTLSTRFTGSRALDRSSSPMEKLESASLTIIDDMQSLNRETPVRRSRRTRLASNETTVTTVQSTTVVKADDGETKFEITFQSEEITSETVVAELSPAVEENEVESPLQVAFESASSSQSQRSSRNLDEVSLDVAEEAVKKVKEEEDKDEINQETEIQISEPEPELEQKEDSKPIAKATIEVQAPVNDMSHESEEKVTSETRTRRRRRSDNQSISETAAPEAKTDPPVPEDSAKLAGRRRRRHRKPSADVSSSDHVTSDSTTTTPETEVVELPSNETEKPIVGEVPSRDETPEIAEQSSVGDEEQQVASSGDKDKEESDIKAASVVVEAETASDDKEATSEIENTTPVTETTTTPVVEDITEPDKTEIVVPEIKVEETKPEEPEKPAEKTDTMRYSIDNLADITEEEVLDKMLDEADEYEERRLIRSALRELRKKKRAGGVDSSKPKTTGRYQSSVTTNGRHTPKTDTKDSYKPSSGLHRRGGAPLGDSKVNRTTTPKSLADKYSLSSSNSTSKKDMSTGNKKVGSIFDRGDDEVPKKSGSRLDLERRQADRRRELQRNRSMPATSTKDARKMFAKMDIATSGDSKVKKVGRSPTFVVPNANNVKQMLLKWCQSKTRGYEHVDINNFSGSWANGMAFCALVHNFFPQAFEYSELDPKNRAHNFDLAFNTAQEYADADPLLDVEDMMIMGNRPDSKCVFTYVQSLYNKLRKFEKPLKPLSPTVKVMPGIVEVDSNTLPKAVTS